MAAAIRFLDLRFAGADDHVELLVDQFGDQLGRRRRIVGRIAVGHYIDVGLDVGEHPAHDMALALHPLGADDGAGLNRDLAGPVGAVIVVDVDARGGQRGAKARDGLRDRRFLVVAGKQDRDCEFPISTGIPPPLS